MWDDALNDDEVRVRVCILSFCMPVKKYVSVVKLAPVARGESQVPQLASIFICFVLVTDHCPT